MNRDEQYENSFFHHQGHLGHFSCGIESKMILVLSVFFFFLREHKHGIYVKECENEEKILLRDNITLCTGV